MQAIELETMIDRNGMVRLPEEYRAFFGSRAKFIVLIAKEKDSAVSSDKSEPAQDLMQFAGTIDWPMDDPVEYQRQIRKEWDRSWE